MALSRGCSRVCPDARFSLRDPGVLGGQFAFLYVDLRLRDLRALTRSLPLILPCRAPCGSLIRSFQLLTLAGLLMQSFSATASIPERLPRPPGSREALPSSALPPENSADSSVLS
jgi:hypothetical protein